MGFFSSLTNTLSAAASSAASAARAATSTIATGIRNVGRIVTGRQTVQAARRALKEKKSNIQERAFERRNAPRVREAQINQAATRIVRDSTVVPPLPSILPVKRAFERAIAYEIVADQLRAQARYVPPLPPIQRNRRRLELARRGFRSSANKMLDNYYTYGDSLEDCLQEYTDNFQGQLPQRGVIQFIDDNTPDQEQCFSLSELAIAHLDLTNYARSATNAYQYFDRRDYRYQFGPNILTSRYYSLPNEPLNTIYYKLIKPVGLFDTERKGGEFYRYMRHCIESNIPGAQQFFGTSSYWTPGVLYDLLRRFNQYRNYQIQQGVDSEDPNSHLDNVVFNNQSLPQGINFDPNQPIPPPNEVIRFIFPIPHGYAGSGRTTTEHKLQRINLPITDPEGMGSEGEIEVLLLNPKQLHTNSCFHSAIAFFDFEQAKYIPQGFHSQEQMRNHLQQIRQRNPALDIELYDSQSLASINHFHDYIQTFDVTLDDFVHDPTLKHTHWHDKNGNVFQHQRKPDNKLKLYYDHTNHHIYVLLHVKPPSDICEECQTSSDTFYSNIHQKYMCATCTFHQRRKFELPRYLATLKVNSTIDNANKHTIDTIEVHTTKYFDFKLPEIEKDAPSTIPPETWTAMCYHRAKYDSLRQNFGKDFQAKLANLKHFSQDRQYPILKEHLGLESYTFTPQEFTDWLLQQYKLHNTYTFFAHDSSKQDSILLLQPFMSIPQYFSQSSFLHKGTSIITMRFANHVFLDSRKYMDLTQDEIDSSFDLPIYERPLNLLFSMIILFENLYQLTDIVITGLPFFKNENERPHWNSLKMNNKQYAWTHMMSRIFCKISPTLGSFAMSIPRAIHNFTNANKGEKLYKFFGIERVKYHSHDRNIKGKSQSIYRTVALAHTETCGGNYETVPNLSPYELYTSNQLRLKIDFYRYQHAIPIIPFQDGHPSHHQLLAIEACCGGVCTTAKTKLGKFLKPQTCVDQRSMYSSVLASTPYYEINKPNHPFQQTLNTVYTYKDRVHLPHFPQIVNYKKDVLQVDAASINNILQGFEIHSKTTIIKTPTEFQEVPRTADHETLFDTQLNYIYHPNPHPNQLAVIPYKSDENHDYSVHCLVSPAYHDFLKANSVPFPEYKVQRGRIAVNEVQLRELERYGYQYEISNAEPSYVYVHSARRSFLYYIIAPLLLKKEEQDLKKKSPDYNSAIRQVSKLMLNIYTGKMAESPFQKTTTFTKSPTYAQWSNAVDEDGSMVNGYFMFSTPTHNKKIPSPMASRIYALSKVFLFYFLAIHNWEYLRIETDSVLFHTTPQSQYYRQHLEGISAGQWEYLDVKQSIILGRKTSRITFTDGTTKSTFRGMSKEAIELIGQERARIYNVTPDNIIEYGAEEIFDHILETGYYSINELHTKRNLLSNATTLHNHYINKHFDFHENLGLPAQEVWERGSRDKVAYVNESRPEPKPTQSFSESLTPCDPHAPKYSFISPGAIPMAVS